MKHESLKTTTRKITKNAYVRALIEEVRFRCGSENLNANLLRQKWLISVPDPTAESQHRREANKIYVTPPPPPHIMHRFPLARPSALGRRIDTDS